jgi:hypothetical protein
VLGLPGEEPPAQGDYIFILFNPAIIPSATQPLLVRHSLSRNLIRLWIRKYEAGEFTDELAEAVHIAEYERKIAELERKVGQLTMEVDLLKKGAQLGRPLSDASYSIVSAPKPSPLRGDAES